jgi:hypothetical protein
MSGAFRSNQTVCQVRLGVKGLRTDAGRIAPVWGDRMNRPRQHTFHKKRGVAKMLLGDAADVQFPPHPFQGDRQRADAKRKVEDDVSTGALP